MAAVTTPLVLQQKSISALRMKQRLVEQQATQPQAEVFVRPTEPPDNVELLRLRAEVALLRGQSNLWRAQAPQNTPTQARAQVPVAAAAVPSETWGDRGFASPMDTLQTAHWAIRNANIEKFRESIVITDQARQKLHDLIAKMAAKAPPEEARKVLDEVAARGWDAEEGLLFR